MTRRTRIRFGVGDILETAGAGGACVAVWHLAGLWWGVLLAAVLVALLGNLVYGQHGFTVALPNRWDVARVRYRLLAPARIGRRSASRAFARVRS